MRRHVAVVIAVIAAGFVGVVSPPSPAGASPGPVPTAYTAIDAGVGFRCAVTAAGGVNCWGYDGDGSLGRGAVGPDQAVPGPVVGLPAHVVAVVTGESHACALTGEGDGEVWCWGGRALGQTGTTVDSGTPQPTPAKVAGLPDVVAITAGTTHTCAATELGDVWCWGDNNLGQLGPGSSDPTATPVAVTGLPEVDQLTAGYGHTCARGVDGSAWCWGSNTYGQVGNGTTDADPVAPVEVAGIGASVRLLRAGSDSTCALTTAGGLRCWGSNSSYQLGDGTTTDRLTPVTPTGLGSGVRSFDLGVSHGCAVGAAGGLSCWGRNGGGEVGRPLRPQTPTPTAVPGLTTGVRAVAGTDSGTCALLVAGSVKCWGQAYSGELGDGTDGTRPTPGAVSPTSITDIAVNGYAGCAVRGAGLVRCWGTNAQGLLGDGTTTDSVTSVGATGITDAIQVDLGLFHACEVEADGQVRCWGSNAYGELGTGGSSSGTPVLVTGIGGDAVSVAAGSRYSCAARPSGVKCWGDNSNGQLGDGTKTTRTTPTPVSNISTAVSEVTTARFHSCARLGDGSVRCWGTNNGRLGNGSNNQALTPVTPTGITSGATSVAAGDDHTCVAVSGAVKCWGGNAYGQVGNSGSAATSTSPYAIPSLTSGWVEVAAGDHISCARSSAGQVKCWGSNRRHMLGGGTTDSQTATPVEVIASGATALDASSSGETICAAKSDGSGVCWGENANAQAGTDPGWTPRTVSGGSVYQGGSPWAPFASWTSLVNQQYTDLLARSATTTERSAAVNALTAATTTPGEVLAGLRADVDQTGAVDPTTRLYFAYFLRIPDKGGLTYWIGRKRSGTQLRVISDNFAGSNEFKNRYGSLTNSQFVELIYQNLFNRAGDVSGVNYWTTKLDTKAESRGGVMAQFSESSEYKRKMGSEVTVSVFDLLVQQRQPLQVDFDAAVARLDEGSVTAATLADELLGTSAYRARFA